MRGAGRGGRLRELRIATAIAVGAFVAWPAPAQAAEVRLVVNGRPVLVRGDDVRVTDALRAAGVQLRAGWMHAFKDNGPLAAQLDPPKLWRDDRAAAADTRLRSGDQLRAVDGADFVEPVTEFMTAITPSGLPEVEYNVWNVGVAGVARRRVGTVSGQVADDVVTAPQPATMVPGQVALFTFDDGPDPRWTPAVLDILRDKGVKAVFCLVGLQIHRYPELVKRIHDEGHVLCDHTENHDMYMSSKPEDYVRAMIQAPWDEIRDITGVTPRFYRGPGGDLSPFIINEAHRLGMRVLGWSVDSVDYRRPGAGTIQNRIALGLRPAGVALMHDGGGDRSQTVAQLPGLIDRVRAAGYTLVVP